MAIVPIPIAQPLTQISATNREELSARIKIVIYFLMSCETLSSSGPAGNRFNDESTATQRFTTFYERHVQARLHHTW